MTKSGFLVLAQNGPSGDYLRLAYGLALSIQRTQKRVKDITVGITPGMKVPKEYERVLDVIEIPWGDDAEEASWKINNKWKIYHMSPYEETIFLDADMLFPSDIGAWWGLLRRQNLITCPTACTHAGLPVTSNEYREWFRVNAFPDVYTTCLYFKKSEEVSDYFTQVEGVFKYWDGLRIEHNLPTRITGDLGFALAAKNGGVDVSPHPVLKFTHMKGRALGFPDDDWEDYVSVYVRSDGSILAGNYLQTLPFHYVNKNFLTNEIIEELGGTNV